MTTHLASQLMPPYLGSNTRITCLRPIIRQLSPKIMPDSIIAKELFSAAAFVVTVALFVPYIRSIRKGQTIPHVFSWTIWALGTFIVFFAQLVGGAGVGAWPIGFSACVTCYIAVLAYFKRHQSSITTLDWFLFALALTALPAWGLTSDPLWAVVLLTTADIIGFGPTVRRAYFQPHQEHAGFFALGAFRNTLVVLALESYSWTTVLFPAAVGIACLFLACFLYMRRRIISVKDKGEG
jgi:hypothetical protein